MGSTPTPALPLQTCATTPGFVLECLGSEFMCHVFRKVWFARNHLPNSLIYSVFTFSPSYMDITLCTLPLSKPKSISTLRLSELSLSALTVMLLSDLRVSLFISCSSVCCCHVFKVCTILGTLKPSLLII